MKQAKLSIINTFDQKVSLEIYSETKEPQNLWKLNEAEAEEFGEAQVQIREGFSYEYELTDGFTFLDQGVIFPSNIKGSVGRIKPGIFVGTLKFYIQDEENNECGFFELEVRSSKTSYRNDYRFMLESIADRSTDLILRSTSPVFQRLTYDYDADPETDYQRFAFVQSMLSSDEFVQAVNRILTYPVSNWSEIRREKDIRRLRGFSSSDLKQITSDPNRYPIPGEHPIHKIISSLPRRITTSGKERTLDTPENRFVKHALSEFRDFCSSIRVRLNKANSRSSRAYKEAVNLEEQLTGILNRDFFRGLSPPETLPLNSPVLQRKEGYRDVLRIWLLFDLAARLVWKGGEDVYHAGKRDVALLYEYWLFFVLTDLIGDVFSLKPDIDGLFEETSNGLGIKLKSGKQTIISGKYVNPIRDLAVEFSYNKTFSGNSDYPDGGSWTKSMRPDYSLSFWPSDIDRRTAEHQELIVHIHFDAKYRVKDISEILGDEDMDIDQEKDEERRGTYKRADLLKMHAYKDAIRRTAGAYVLYPGKGKEELLRGFHEIIPGLGAFTIRPSREDNGSKGLIEFLERVRSHFLNRASQRDRLSYETFDIFKERDDREIKEPLPEFIDGRRIKPPSETFVLVGFCKNDEHYKWIKENNLYNFRLTGRGAISDHVDPEMLLADYILLHWEGHVVTGDIYRTIHGSGLGPKIMTSISLEDHGYPDPRHDEYLVYRIESEIEKEFAGARWDLRKLDRYVTGRGSGLPFAVALVDLMEGKVVD